MSIRTRTRRRRRALAAAAIVGVVAGLTATHGVDTTEASWTDSEHAGSEITAATLHAPTVVSPVAVCARPSLINLGTVLLRFQWSVPAIDGHALDAGNVRWTIGSSEIQASATAPVAGQPGVYRTTLTAGLLDGLIGGLLGSSYVVTGHTVMPTANGTPDWTSAPTTITVSWPPVLGSATCTVSHGP